QLLGDQRERGIPVDRLVVGRARPQHHRLGQPALLAQPVVGAFGQVVDRVLGEELPRHPALGGLLRDGFRAVLAELDVLALLARRFLRLRPGAARAVEPFPLVDQPQRAHGAHRADLLDGPLHRDGHAWDACRPILRLADFQLCFVDVCLRCFACHVPMMHLRQAEPESQKGQVIHRYAERMRLRRVYDEPSPDDGTRVLVDRVWPRGVSKDQLDAEWVRDVAPSTELRKWFGHDPERFAEFTRRYREELESETAQEGLWRLRALAERGPVTLLTATRDIEHSHAGVLVDLLNDKG